MVIEEPCLDLDEARARVVGYQLRAHGLRRIEFAAIEICQCAVLLVIVEADDIVRRNHVSEAAMLDICQSTRHKDRCKTVVNSGWRS